MPLSTDHLVLQPTSAIDLQVHTTLSDGDWTPDALLDDLRAEAPIDGLEAYYPTHTPQQTAAFLAYAEQHSLLVSAGSDSHRPSKPPIAYPADLCRPLLQRLGIRFSH